MRKVNKVKKLTNIKKGCFMKGRIFITIMTLAIMLVSTSAMAQLTLDTKIGGSWTQKIDTSDIGDLKLVYGNGTGTGKAAAAESKVAMIDCTHPHGLVQIMDSFGESILKPLLASKVYLAQIEADKTIDMAKYVGVTENGNYSPGYFGVMSQMISNPLYWQSQMYSNGYGNSSNSGYYGSYNNSMSNPRW
jgi:hypothetical protein